MNVIHRLSKVSYRPVFRSLLSAPSSLFLVTANKCPLSFGMSHARPQLGGLLFNMARPYSSSSATLSALRTKQGAAKRLLKTGSGKLKHSHPGKSHLNGHKSRRRLRRLAQKGLLSGTYEKKMKQLIITGK